MQLLNAEAEIVRKELELESAKKRLVSLRKHSQPSRETQQSNDPAAQQLLVMPAVAEADAVDLMQQGAANSRIAQLAAQLAQINTNSSPQNQQQQSSVPPSQPPQPAPKPKPAPPARGRPVSPRMYSIVYASLLCIVLHAVA